MGVQDPWAGGNDRRCLMSQNKNIPNSVKIYPEHAYFFPSIFAPQNHASSLLLWTSAVTSSSSSCFEGRASELLPMLQSPQLQCPFFHKAFSDFPKQNSWLSPTPTPTPALCSYFFFPTLKKQGQVICVQLHLASSTQVQARAPGTNGTLNMKSVQSKKKKKSAQSRRGGRHLAL